MRTAEEDSLMDPKSHPLSYFLSAFKMYHLVGGFCGGVVATLITHPFDLIKLRLAVHDGVNVHGRSPYTGFFHGVKTAVKETGLASLYRGASANVAGSGISWGMYFFLTRTMWSFTSSYKDIKEWRTPNFPTKTMFGVKYNVFKYNFQKGDATKALNPLYHFVCATSAGILTLSVTNPIWVVKTRLCLPDTPSVPSHMRYSGLRDGLYKLYTHEGLKGLYKGFVPGLFGTSHGAIQFMIYEELKRQYTHHHSMSVNAALPPLAYITMAASSKISAVSITYPYQVVRARLQDQDARYNGVSDVLHKTFRNEGLAGFYKGITANLLKVVPATCITFVVYETVSAVLH